MPITSKHLTPLIGFLLVTLACGLTPQRPVDIPTDTPTSSSPGISYLKSVTVSSYEGGNHHVSIAYFRGAEPSVTLSCFYPGEQGDTRTYASTKTEAAKDELRMDSFDFTLKTAGKYRITCNLGGSYQGADLMVEAVTATQIKPEEGLQLPKLGDFRTADLTIDYKQATSSRAGIDAGHGCWPLHYWADESSTFTVSSTGILAGMCHYEAVIYNNTEEMQGTITGQWDETSEEVTFTLETTHAITAPDNSSVLIYTNLVEGKGKFTTSQVASGTANWTTTMQCQISEACAKAEFSPATGTVQWSMEFRP